MKYLPNETYHFTYRFQCEKKQSTVDIETRGVKIMSLGSAETPIALGNTICAGEPCEFSKNCELKRNAEKKTKIELHK